MFDVNYKITNWTCNNNQICSNHINMISFMSSIAFPQINLNFKFKLSIIIYLVIYSLVSHAIIKKIQERIFLYNTYLFKFKLQITSSNLNLYSNQSFKFFLSFISIFNFKYIFNLVIPITLKIFSIPFAKEIIYVPINSCVF